MKLNRTWLSAALALAAIAGLNLAEARAGSITQVQSIGQTALPINTTFDFDGYSGPAGSLTSVVLTVEQTINGVIQILNFNVDSFVGSETASAIVTASSPAGSTDVSAMVSVTDVTVPGRISPGVPGVYESETLAATNSNSTTYTGAGVNPFYGSIATIPVDVTSDSGSQIGSPIGPGRFFGGSITAAVKVTLVYNFTDPIVPEPTSGAMFGIGIVLAAGIGWGRRRRGLKQLTA